MCLNHRFMPRKARIFLAIGNLCLFACVALNTSNHSLAVHHSDWLDFLRGMMIGLGATFVFFSARLARRCRPPANPLAR
jgi:uncharacterized membrane protein YccC